MILYTIGKRFKNFFKVTVLSNIKDKESIISGEQFLKNNRILKEGKVCWSYANGTLKSECSYKNNMLHGISVHYYENGNVKMKETYRENKRDGLTITYNEDGEKISEETYHHGALISKINYDSHDKETDEKRS